jgi:hypothetical protein
MRRVGRGAGVPGARARRGALKKSAHDGPGGAGRSKKIGGAEKPYDMKAYTMSPSFANPFRV